jgi:DNA polymerase III subunit beta
MKAVVMKQHLKEGLQVVERAVGRSPSLPILQNVLLTLQKNKMTLSGTDLQMGITCEFLADIKEGGERVFAPRFITPLLGIITEDHVSLETKEGQVIVESGNFRAAIQTVSAEEFPIIPSLNKEDSFVEVRNDILCAGLAQVVGMVGQSQARPEVGGVLFVFEKEVLRLAATDSFRLAEKKIVFEKPSLVEHTFILPQKTAREIIGILSERQGKTKVYFSSSQVIFDHTSEDEIFPAHIQIVSRVIEGEYPDYQNVIPKDHKTKAVFQKEQLLNHVKAASVFSGKTNEVVLSVEPAKKGISFFAQSSEAGENHSFLEAEVSGEKTNVAFNWRFLLDGLAQIKGSQVEMSLNGEDGPALLRASDQGGYLYVIMPIKA